MSSEESNKTSQKTPSQDYPSDLMWDIEELKRSIVESAEQSYNFEDMARRMRSSSLKKHLAREQTLGMLRQGDGRRSNASYLFLIAWYYRLLAKTVD